MFRRNVRTMSGVLLILVVSAPTWAEELEQTVGLMHYDPASYEGYTLFTPMLYTETYLIDIYGRLIHSWSAADKPGKSAYLLEDGTLLRPAFPGPDSNPTFPPAGAGGYVQILDWDSTVLWEFEYSSDQYLLHHDMELLPNGNILMIAWEYKSFDASVTAGRDPKSLIDGELYPDHIIEVEPAGAVGGEIVWEWHVWDHLIQDFDATKDNFGVVEDHPELLDINYFANPTSEGFGARNMVKRGAGADWLHSNGIDYHAEFDQIILSVTGTDEFFILDHSTTTEEAAGHTGGIRGHGGDILYRWGNPQAYRSGGGEHHRLGSPHHATWIEPGLPGEGNVIVMNTRRLFEEPDHYSSIDEMVIPVDKAGNYPELGAGEAYGPTAPTWSYMAEPVDDFFTPGGNAKRLPNGNTLIDKADTGTLFEVNTAGETVWTYTSPVKPGGPINQGDVMPVHPPQPDTLLNKIFKMLRYSPDYAGLAGRDLTPGSMLELYPPDGDFHDDGQVDADDFEHFVDCYTDSCGDGPCEPPLYVNPWCTVADFNDDWDVDCADFFLFALAWSIPEEIPLFAECPLPCFGDANGDGTVDPLDVGLVLAHFGCDVGAGDPECDAADQNFDGSVNPLDSGFVMARFGACD
ncbi:MAG: aryl-sulfate sulfotransferase [Planctomycetes bacterium]|nr:aryl-sulfate sulfotransferase [Planctomycetota bacterium]